MRFPRHGFLLAWIAFGERMSLLQLLGVVMIVGG
ncbi:EamA family transporter, partial [bacterium CPR1]|nr:EamA family transporter [bacterium CPR1]